MHVRSTHQQADALSATREGRHPHASPDGYQCQPLVAGPAITANCGVRDESSL